MEAIAAGAYPLLPQRLAYPEVLALKKHPERECFFYQESADDLGKRLLECCSAENDLWADAPASPEELVSQYYWSKAAPKMASQLLNI